MFRLSVAVVASALCVSAGEATVYSVPAGGKVTVTTSSAYDILDVEGELTVPSDVTFSASTNYLGRNSTARLNVAGGTFGTTPGKPYATLSIGDNGGSGKITVTEGGTFMNGHTYIRANTAPDDTGYIDFLEIDGTSTLMCRNFYNYSSVPARTRVLSGKATFASAGGAYYYHYYTGDWVIDVAEGATVVFNRAYREGEYLTESGATLVFSGAGDVSFAGSGEKSFCVRSGTTFGHSGWIVNNVKDLVFNDGVVIGDQVKGIKASAPVRFKGNVSAGDMAVSGTGVFTGPAGGATVTLGENGRDSVISGEAFTDSTLSLVKTGTGELTVDGTVPYLPTLSVVGGSVRMKGGAECEGVSLAAGTQLIVDGCVWTMDGDSFSMAEGATVTTVNNGCIILKVTDGNTPSFPAGTELDVLEYWVDGVLQDNGVYDLDGTVITAYRYSEEGKTVWSNDGSSAAGHEFQEGDEYLGMLLKAPPTELHLHGGETVIGSSGISTEISDGASLHCRFGMPLVPAVGQVWDFGGASASFSGPLGNARGVQTYGELSVFSDGALEFATTNSTYSGTMSISGRTVRVSGKDVFGDCTNALTVTVDRNTYPDSNITFDGVTVNRQTTLNHHGSESYALVFDGTNTFNGYVDMSNASRARFKKDSVTYFNGGAYHYNYVNLTFERNARVVYGGVINLMGYYGSRSYNLNAENVDRGTCAVRFNGKVNVEDTDEYSIRFHGFNIEFGTDMAFREGLIYSDKNTVMDLEGHDQRFTQVYGSGLVTSSVPANVEIDTPSGMNMTNALVFAGSAGLKMVGEGVLTVTDSSDTAGELVVENGRLELEGRWQNAEYVSVSGDGVLAVCTDSPFPRTVTLSLSGSGGIEVPAGKVVRVGELVLVNPETGESVRHGSGLFGPSETSGLVSGGSVRVGKIGMKVVVR